MPVKTASLALFSLNAKLITPWPNTWCTEMRLVSIFSITSEEKKSIYYCFTWICVENCNKPCLNSSSLVCPTNMTHPHINTCFLNSWHSSGVRVSAFAMRGMTLTLSWSLFMNSMSSGFRLKDRQIGNPHHQHVNWRVFIVYSWAKSDWCDKLNRFIITEKHTTVPVADH